MEEKNNFKKVFEQEAPEQLREDSLRNVQGSIHTVKSFFDVLDLYISKFFGAIIHSFKDNSSIQYGIGTGVGVNKEEDVVVEHSDDDMEIEDENEEDWYTDNDLPKDL